MRRVPENKAAEAFEVLMSKAAGGEEGSLNSEDAAVANLYMLNRLGTGSMGSVGRCYSVDSRKSADSRKSSVGKLDGSAVVYAGDAHAAMRRALSLVKHQADLAALPEDPGQPGRGHAEAEWRTRPLEKGRSPDILVKGGREVERSGKLGYANGYGGGLSDAAIQAFVRNAFSRPGSQRSSVESQHG